MAEPPKPNGATAATVQAEAPKPAAPKPRPQNPVFKAMGRMNAYSAVLTELTRTRDA